VPGVKHAGAFFVIGAKSNLLAYRVYSAASDRSTGVIADQTITLEGTAWAGGIALHNAPGHFSDRV